MAKKEPNKPDEVKADPATETPTEGKNQPEQPLEAKGANTPPEMTAEETATPPQEAGAVLGDKGEEQPAQSTPIDIGGKQRPGDDVVVPFDKINEIVSEKKAAAKAQEAEQAAPDKPEQEAPAKKTGRGRPPKADKPAKEPKPEKAPKAEKTAKPVKKQAPAKEEAPAPAKPPEPREAPRSGEQEQVVYINLSELHPFKDHPFQVRKDEEMAAMVESVKDKGVTQAAIVRPREGGGYEMVSGHRRQMASELAGFTNMPCIVRNLTDEQAITQMVEDNTTQREAILPSERAKALKMQLDAIKQQGARTGNGQRSNEVVAERNKMTVKQVQRYIKLNDLAPDLMKMVDAKKIAFTPAVELAYIKPKNQRYIAIAIEGQQSAPSLSQAQRMRELDQKNLLNSDVIDGIMLEEKKEADKVILSSQELGQYFGKDKTPREMKDTILKLLDEYKAKQPPELNKPEKKAAQEKLSRFPLTSGQVDPKLLLGRPRRPTQRSLYIPRRRGCFSADGINLSRARSAAYGGLPLTDFSGCAFLRPSGGDIYSFEPLPFQDWKGRGDRLILAELKRRA